jgi:hypothetical protein
MLAQIIIAVDATIYPHIVSMGLRWFADNFYLFLLLIVVCGKQRDGCRTQVTK